MIALLQQTLRTIMENGLKIDVVYDIGACEGNFSRWMKYNLTPYSEFYLFEANESYLLNLSDPHFNSFIATLSDEDGREVKFWAGTNTGDSYYKETTSIYDSIEEKSQICTTLDKLISDKNLPIPNFVKIDTQGSELDILCGAKSLVGKSELILCECPIIEYNKGAPKMSDYLDFFKSRDYIPIELIHVHRAENTILQMDFLFMLRSAKYQFLSQNQVIRV